MRRIMRVHNLARLRNSGTSGGSKVRQVTGTSVTPFVPDLVTLPFLEKGKPKKPEAKPESSKMDPMKMPIVERRKRKRFDVKI